MSNLIDLMNVKYILVAQNSPPQDPNLTVDISQGYNERPVGELVEGTTVEQSFVSNHANLAAVGILFATYARSNTGLTIVHLRTGGSTADIANFSLKNTELPNNDWVTLSFPQVSDSEGKFYSMIVESKGTSPGNAVTIWSTSSSPRGGTLRINSTAQAGSICFMTYFRVQRYKLVYQDSGVRIFENTHVFPRAFLVHEALRTNNALQDLRTADERGIDLRKVALIAPDSPIATPLGSVSSPEIGDDNITIEEYQPEKIDIEVRSTMDGLLIISNVFYPGWSAYVDGKPSPIVRADHALQGIVLPAGTHRVQLVYAPEFASMILFLTITSSLVVAFLLLGRTSNKGGKLHARGSLSHDFHRAISACHGTLELTSSLHLVLLMEDELTIRTIQ
jgi:hypothetical protein